jgi:hypothetical protein
VNDQGRHVKPIEKKIRALLHKDELENELDEELRFHLERDTAQNL